ncbi:MAG TPA: cupin domain-containing protein [Azospirillaceae bacterium]|nr:cupin domain-containing protein [Azospirillaceae bacterium]
MAREPEILRLGPGAGVPNNPRMPLLVYRRVLSEDEPAGGDLAAGFERLFAANGWTGAWRDGIYDYHHFHCDAHEVLGIARGRALVRFGGEDGVDARVEAGDVVVVPAGVGHKRLEASPDLLVVGAYPGGRDPDMHRPDPVALDRLAAAAASVPVPDADPVQGPDGALVRLWGG